MKKNILKSMGWGLLSVLCWGLVPLMYFIALDAQGMHTLAATYVSFLGNAGLLGFALGGIFCGIMGVRPWLDRG